MVDILSPAKLSEISRAAEDDGWEAAAALTEELVNRALAEAADGGVFFDDLGAVVLAAFEAAEDVVAEALAEQEAA